MISAVLDANTIASGILGYRNPDSIPGAILRSWRKGFFILVTSQHISMEVREVLRKPYFTSHLTPQEISRMQALLKFQARQVVITESVRSIATHVEDVEDDLVLATAVSSGADYLVTGDKPLLQKVGRSYRKVNLVTPNEFLQVLKKQS